MYFPRIHGQLNYLKALLAILSFNTSDMVSNIKVIMLIVLALWYSYYTSMSICKIIAKLYIFTSVLLNIVMEIIEIMKSIYILYLNIYCGCI